jgi:CPA1 family monovalent cation:H+ antiporter
MNLPDIIALLLSLAAIFSYINYRFLRLPSAIGLMLIALLMSLGIILVELLGFELRDQAEKLIRGINFDKTLLHGMLSFLLFAGALHVNLNELIQQKLVIVILATVGVITSTLLIGVLTWWLLAWFGLDTSFLYCLIFGALISPTDPIAVLGIMKKAGVPKSLEIKIAGESLFNDGIGVVIFLVLLGLISGSGHVDVQEVLVLFAEEALGGIVFGLLIGAIAFYMLRSVDQYQVEILTTLALAMGGYALAGAIHVSGPIAIVVAGLMIGNHGRRFAMSDTTREHLDTFWELVDEILNAVLFVMIGLEVLVLAFVPSHLLVGILAIPIVLLARFISVGIPVSVLRYFREFSPRVITILTWGGLRGGISVALALSLPQGPERELILTITYIVVIFSILVQGLSISRLVARK